MKDRPVAEETSLVLIEITEQGFEGVCDLRPVWPLETDLQAVGFRGRLDGGREVCEHRGLLVLVPENEDRPQGARASDVRRLLDDVVDLPRALEGEPAPLEAVSGHEAAGFAAFQVGDKADALGRAGAASGRPVQP